MRDILATYVMSDIHGEFEKYKMAIEAIELKDEDTLFILGDVVDRGPNPIKILLDMMYRVNLIPLLGNHEFVALSVLKVLVKEITEDTLPEFDSDFMVGLQHWLEDGGQTTLTEFKALSQDERESIIEYLEEFQLYDEVSCGEKNYVLVHAGLDKFKRSKSLSDYKLHELIYAETDYDKVHFKDKILVTGHTPTKLIWGKDEIYKGNNHIAIDCGCAWGGKLAVYCLDDGREFYV